MSGKRPEPPRKGVWTRAIEDINAETEARAAAAGAEPVRGGGAPHAGHGLEGDAAKRLDAALRAPLTGESLVAALEAWEIREGDPVAAYRAREGIADRRADRTRLRDVRKMLDRLPDDYMTETIPDLIAVALAVEGCPGAPQGHEVGRVARKAARPLIAALPIWLMP